MAKIATMPAQHIIDGYKGTLDFYIYKRQPCCRKWPVWKPRTPTPAEKENQDRFAFINKIAKTLDPIVIQFFMWQAQSTPLSWKDLLVQAYMKGLNY